MSFSKGDRVRFKGDPEGVEYPVTLKNTGGTYELRNDNGDNPDYIPERLLELVPEPVAGGQLWIGVADDWFKDQVVFVTEAYQGNVFFIGNGYDHIKTLPLKEFRRTFKKETA